MPNPPRTRRAASAPAVLVPITIGDSDPKDAVLESVAAFAAGATGIDLSIPDPQMALEKGLAIADQLADASGLRVFIRSDGPISPGDHMRICPSAGHFDRSRSTGPCVLDLGIDRLGLLPDAVELASHWPDRPDRGSGTPFMISTVGFGSAVDAELMALATLAAMRGAAAITTDRIRIVRRVVDTVAVVLEAKAAA